MTMTDINEQLTDRLSR